MNRKEAYKEMIAEAVDGCADIELLDLVWKLLANAQEVDPDPAPAPARLEVRNNLKMGNRCKRLSMVFGETDSLQSAA